MSNDNKIIWQKWIDPFGRDNEIEENNEEYNNYITEEDGPLDNELEDYNTQTKQSLKDNIKYGIRVIATPMGIVPVNDNTASGKIFNFWIGHTNFDITPKVAETIEQTDGVESLDIYTRYRFRISVGKAFDDSYVMRDINKNVYKGLSDAY